MRQWSRAARFLIAADICVCALAYGFIFLNVKTVCLSGPVLALMAIATLISARRVGYPRGLWVGAAHLGICLLFFGLVNLLGWAPRDAEAPFRCMGAAYVLLMVPVSWYAWIDVPSGFGPGECQGCGYALYGLTEPRCPECGRTFSPVLLNTLSPPESQSQRQA